MRRRILGVVGERKFFTPRVDGLPPRRNVANVLGGSIEGNQRVLDLTTNGYVGTANLVELSRIDVGVNNFGVWCESVESARHAVVKTGTQGDQKISLLHGRNGRVHAVHTGHTEVETMGIREGATSHQGRYDGNVGALGEGQEFRTSAGLQDTTTDVEQWSLGGGNQCGGGFD